MAHEAKLEPKAALPFILAGNSTFTIKSLVSGTRYTYKVRKAKDDPRRPPMWFVKLLTGPENTSDYTYIGMVGSNERFRLTSKSKMKADSQPVQVIDWFLRRAAEGEPKNVEVWHTGRCGRCGRLLTVPESVEAGIGPECAGRMGN